MKNSEILQKVLERFNKGVEDRLPGICDNLSGVIYELGLSGTTRFMECMRYVRRYKPDNNWLYWWPTDDRQSRIDVLKLAIKDAQAASD